jgi:hypothetical protein
MYLMHWKVKPLEEATWEEANVMARQFPSPNREDKVVSQGVDIDGDTNKAKTWRVYDKRNKYTSLTYDMADQCILAHIF